GLMTAAGPPPAARLPEPRGGFRWRMLADSRAPDREETLPATELELPARAVLLVAEVASRARPRLADDAQVAELAEAAGIAPEWHTIAGDHHRVSPVSQRALLTA